MDEQIGQAVVAAITRAGVDKEPLNHHGQDSYPKHHDRRRPTDQRIARADHLRQGRCDSSDDTDQDGAKIWHHLTALSYASCSGTAAPPENIGFMPIFYSTVTLLARFRGLSTSVPLSNASS
jgi:hypothetical protein